MNTKTRIFYKYKSCYGDIDDKNTDFYHLIDSLENKYFYLARPINLNDIHFGIISQNEITKN